MFFCGGNFLSLHQLSIKLTPPVICRWYVNIYSSKCKKLTQLTTSSPIQNWFFKSSSRWSKSSCKQIQNWPNLFLSKTSQQLIAGRQLVRFPNPHYVVSWRISMQCTFAIAAVHWQSMEEQLRCFFNPPPLTLPVLGKEIRKTFVD